MTKQSHIGVIKTNREDGASSAAEATKLDLRKSHFKVGTAP
jgi:hypothetical protein